MWGSETVLLRALEVPAWHLEPAALAVVQLVAAEEHEWLCRGPLELSEMAGAHAQDRDELPIHASTSVRPSHQVRSVPRNHA